MCKEVSLIQTHLGVWKLEDWTIKQASTQLSHSYGVYCIKNLINEMVLIGEGDIGRRTNRHIGLCSNNISWLKDIEKYGPDNFRLIWTIEEEGEIKRKLIENKLQIYFSENCYNNPRREYPTQKQLLEDIVSPKNTQNPKTIVERLKDYIKVQRNYIDECWELTNTQKADYSRIKYQNRMYQSHILMYIINYGDICGVSSVIHHNCENKKCINPEHLKCITHIENVRLHHNINNIEKEAYRLGFNQSTVPKYRGVCFYEDLYLAQVRDNTKNINLGRYDNEIHAAQNRDYYIVKNNLWDQKFAKLNFYDIDYNNFTPHVANSGKINKYLI